MSDFESAKKLFFDGLDFFKTGRFEDAESRFENSLIIVPNRVSTLTNLAATKIKLRKIADGRALASQALALDPQNSEAYVVLGLAELESRDPNAAIEQFAKATDLNPELIEAWCNTGAALSDLQRYEEALACYDKALAINPAYAEAWSNKGVALNALRFCEAALTHYDRALQINPAYAEAWSNKGVTLSDLQRHEDALDAHARAIELNRDNAKAWFNKGVALFELKRFDEALVDFQRALKLNPSLDFLRGLLVFTQMKLCSWRDFDLAAGSVISGVNRGEKIATPFAVLALSASEATNLKVAQTWAAEKCPPRNSGTVFAKKRAAAEKIRLGYFSSDFHDHAIGYLTAGLYEAHDKTRYELIAFSLGRSRHDDTRRRIIAAFDRFIDINDKSDPEVAELARSLGIDIAIDVNGYTQSARSGIFSCRAAPIQVNYLGYPGSMGAEFMDYIVADRTLIPESNQPFFSEKIVYLPHCYQPNDSKRQIGHKRPTRAELGLPESGFVFCCFNNNHKINPATFDLWMRILKQVDGSVLWLFEDSPLAAKNLKLEAANRGISAERLIFATVVSHSEHLARHRAADLFLDTLPYNAHTTASDALWAGVPLLTLIGNTFAGRVAASLLKAVHMPELVTTRAEDFEAMAIELARTPEKLAQLKLKLAGNRLSAPLFNTAMYAKHLEAAYAEMHRRYVDELAPDHLYIAASSSPG